MYKKEDIYDDSKQKISRFAKNVHVSMAVTPDLAIDITQNPKDGTYTLKQGEFDEPMIGYMSPEEDELYGGNSHGVHTMGFTTIAEGVDRPTLYQKLESLGVSAECVVERESDLEDFKEPVVMHKQSEAEKRAILSEVKKMKVGDELTFTLPDVRTEDGNYVVKGQTVSLACIEEDSAHVDTKFQYVVRDRADINKTEASKVPQTRQVGVKDVIGEMWVEENIFLKHHPDEMAFNTPEEFTIDKITNLKLNRGRYTREEIEDLKEGKSIDYDKVCARNPIKDKEKYMEYVLESNRPDFTKGENIAYGTIKQEWDAAINKIPNWRKKAMIEKEIDGKQVRFEDSLKRVKPLEKEYQKQYEREHPGISTEPYQAQREMEHKVRMTQAYAMKDKNMELTDAIITLRRAAQDFELQGKNWKNLADKCNEASDRLTMGDNLGVVITANFKSDANIKQVAKKIDEMYPEMKKGLDKLNSDRINQIRDDFDKQQRQVLAEQLEAQKEKRLTEKEQAKENAGKKAPKKRGIHRKSSSKGLER